MLVSLMPAGFLVVVGITGQEIAIREAELIFFKKVHERPSVSGIVVAES